METPKEWWLETERIQGHQSSPGLILVCIACHLLFDSSFRTSPLALSPPSPLLLPCITGNQEPRTLAWISLYWVEYAMMQLLRPRKPSENNTQIAGCVPLFDMQRKLFVLNTMECSSCSQVCLAPPLFWMCLLSWGWAEANLHNARCPPMLQ